MPKNPEIERRSVILSVNIYGVLKEHAPDLSTGHRAQLISSSASHDLAPSGKPVKGGSTDAAPKPREQRPQSSASQKSHKDPLLDASQKIAAYVAANEALITEQTRVRSQTPTQAVLTELSTKRADAFAYFDRLGGAPGLQRLLTDTAKEEQQLLSIEALKLQYNQLNPASTTPSSSSSSSPAQQASADIDASLAAIEGLFTQAVNGVAESRDDDLIATCGALRGRSNNRALLLQGAKALGDFIGTLISPESQQVEHGQVALPDAHQALIETYTQLTATLLAAPAGSETSEEAAAKANLARTVAQISHPASSPLTEPDPRGPQHQEQEGGPDLPGDLDSADKNPILPGGEIVQPGSSSSLPGTSESVHRRTRQNVTNLPDPARRADGAPPPLHRRASTSDLKGRSPTTDIRVGALGLEGLNSTAPSILQPNQLPLPTEDSLDPQPSPLLNNIQTLNPAGPPPTHPDLAPANTPVDISFTAPVIPADMHWDSFRRSVAKGKQVWSQDRINGNSFGPFTVTHDAQVPNVYNVSYQYAQGIHHQLLADLPRFTVQRLTDMAIVPDNQPQYPVRDEVVKIKQGANGFSCIFESDPSAPAVPSDSRMQLGFEMIAQAGRDSTQGNASQAVPYSATVIDISGGTPQQRIQASALAMKQALLRGVLPIMPPKQLTQACHWLHQHDNANYDALMQILHTSVRQSQLLPDGLIKNFIKDEYRQAVDAEQQATANNSSLFAPISSGRGELTAGEDPIPRLIADYHEIATRVPTLPANISTVDTHAIPALTI